MAIAHLDQHLRACLQKIATGPEYSKHLSQDEAYTAMQYILSGEADPVQAGIFFIALRMKRETDEENAGVFQALLDDRPQHIVATAELVDIADPYDGWLRGLPVSAFAPCVLAACGLPSISHGVWSLGPKHGLTTQQVLTAAGVNTQVTVAAAAQQLAQPNIGWAYLDQAQFAPRLYALSDLRERIVKRPVLTTLDTLLQPLRGEQASHLLTGYVHKAYPRVYALLARQAGFQTAAIIRGVEGGVTPSLAQASKLYGYQDDQEFDALLLEPQHLGIQQTQRCIGFTEDDAIHKQSLSELAQQAADLGLAALQGTPGAARDSLIYVTAIALFSAKKCATLEQAAKLAATAIDSGNALSHFLAAKVTA